MLIALPPLVFLTLLIVHRPYIEKLLMHYELLAIATASMALGAAWVHRIVHFDF